MNRQLEAQASTSLLIHSSTITSDNLYIYICIDTSIYIHLPYPNNSSTRLLTSQSSHEMRSPSASGVVPPLGDPPPWHRNLAWRSWRKSRGGNCLETHRKLLVLCPPGVPPQKMPFGEQSHGFLPMLRQETEPIRICEMSEIAPQLPPLTRHIPG